MRTSEMSKALKDAGMQIRTFVTYSEGASEANDGTIDLALRTFQFDRLLTR